MRKYTGVQHIKYLPCCLCGQVVEVNLLVGGGAAYVRSFICSDCYDEHRKCNLEGLEIRPDGIHPLDPCVYEIVEEHPNVTVEVLRCRKCKHQEISWYRPKEEE